MRKILFHLITFGFLSISAQKREKDSLLVLLNSAPNDSLKCLYLVSFIELESDNSVWPSYNAKLKAIAEKRAITSDQKARVFYIEMLSDAITNDGFLKQQTGRINEALADYRKSLEMKFDISDRNGVANNLLNIGYLYYGVADFSKAANYFNKCLKIQEELKDKAGASTTLINLGNVFLSQNDTLKYIELIKKALKYREELGDKKGIAKCYNNLAASDADKDKLDQALKYCQEALKLNLEMEEKEGLGNTYNNLGGIYRRMGDGKKALENYRKGLKLNLEIRDARATGVSYLNLAGIYQSAGNIREAGKAFASALKYAKISGEVKEIKMAAEGCYLFEKAHGNKGEAKRMLDLFTKMNDSLSKKIIIKLEENENDSLMLERDLTKNVEVLKENLTEKDEAESNIGLWPGLIVLILGSGAIIYFFKRRR